MLFPPQARCLPWKSTETMSIIQHLIRRLLLMIPMAIGITLLLFVVTHIVPVNPLAVILTEKSMEDPEAVQAATEKWGLDKPLPVQYLVYLGNLLQGTWAPPSRPRIRLPTI